MLQINQIKIPVEGKMLPGDKTPLGNKIPSGYLEIHSETELLKQKAAKLLRVPVDAISEVHILKKSLDARKKPQLFWIYSISCALKDREKETAVLKNQKSSDISFYVQSNYNFPMQVSFNKVTQPVIIGMGPAGLFCAYMLAKAGFSPIIYERGKRVEERTKDVQDFWNGGKLLLNSNVQFGEGGAGTFSDGKLNTLIKDKTGRNKEVLRILVENGAPEHILYDSKPHIGTDILSVTVANMRKRMLDWGAEVHYESQVTDFIIHNSVLKEIVINHTDTVPVENVVLAIGHSARDTFRTLYEKNVPMAAKDFAVGLRVQHSQSHIDMTQYGESNLKKGLPAASYKLATQTSHNRGVYSFCMCPGGYVVNASSESHRLAVNGMSYSGRDSGVANSAIIVSVTQKDFGSPHPLAGVNFQRGLEEKAYTLGNGCIPVQYYRDFSGLNGKKQYITAPFEPRIKGKYQFANLGDLFSNSVKESFIEGMTRFGKTIPGFDDDFCVLAGIESRTSSPVRIMRNSEYESEIKGLYPCGEGAGYAGGITSAAMDGLAIAEAIAKKYCV